MEINKVQWRMIAKGEKLPCDSFLMRKDGTMTSMVTGAGVVVGQDAYYLPVDELRTLPKEESEDERMVKFIKKQLFNIKKTITENYELDAKLTEAIDWLEKQGKQKPTENKGMNLKEEEMTPFQKEVFYIIDTNIEAEVGLKQECDELLRLAHDEIMQNTAWSEEDEEMLDSIIEEVRYIGDFPDYPTKEENELYDECLAKVEWLKSLKDRVQPQPKQEWSEEDESKRKFIEDELSCLIADEQEIESPLTKRAKDLYSALYWFESLRPQSHWKPSDEQMNTLEYYMHTLICNKHKEILFGLYSDLKKLKG